MEKSRGQRAREPTSSRAKEPIYMELFSRRPDNHKSKKGKIKNQRAYKENLKREDLKGQGGVENPGSLYKQLKARQNTIAN